MHMSSFLMLKARCRQLRNPTTMTAMQRTELMRRAFDLMYFSGATTLLRPALQGQGVIFCLHHVTPGGGLQTGFSPNSNLEITPGFLNDIIALVKRRGFELLSLDAVIERLRAGGKDKAPFAAFTLDDGYRDNLVHAMPVFKANNCPFTVYVAPRIADGTCELWWRILGDVIAENDTIAGKLNGSDFVFASDDLSKKQTAWEKLVAPVQALPEYEQRSWIQTFADIHRFDWQAQCRAAAMTWDEVRAMDADPLATIGAHTLNHYNLLKLPHADALHEMAASKARIEEELGHTVSHFAYPYGNTDAASQREFELCKNAGFATGVTTRLGNIFQSNINNLHALPRVMVSGRFQKTRYIETLISGLPAFAANGFKRCSVV
jgi:peptidoglycan/xylan/chitin deacetylase (PgdA/CDA1 family)